MNTFARIWKLIKCTFYYGLLIAFAVFMTAVLSATPFALLGAIGVVYVSYRFMSWFLFYLMCRIDVGMHTVAGHGRLKSRNRRETRGNAELAYTEHSTEFRTRESGTFIFEDSGYRELRDGDHVKMRLFRWSSSSKIKDYDILGYSFS